MNTSYSAINTFRTCPLKYKFEVVDKIKKPKSPQAVFGTLVHATMKYIHSGDFVCPTQKEALNYFSSNWNSDVFEDEIKERSAFAQGIRMIQEYYRKNDPNQAKIVAVETRFSIALEDENKEKHLISGFIDRIDKTDDGFEIIDYKTSKKMPPQKTIDENLQLLIYLLAFCERYPDKKNELDKIALSLYFLNHGTKLSTKKNAQQLEDGKKDVIETIHEIEKSTFPAIVSPLCDWCEYQKICPMWKHKFKELMSATDEEKEKVIKEYLEAQESSKNERKKAAQLQARIFEIMESENAQRLFGQGKIIAKTHRENFEYDEEKLRPILEEKGLWNNVVKLNQIQLKKATETLPSSVKKKIEETRKLKSQSWGLSVKKQ